VENIPDSLLQQSAEDPELLRIARELGLASYLCVPMISRGKVVGVITFVGAESGRRYRPADLALAEDLARRAAVALENAQLYAELRDADRRKDEFLATLAHELRNPLAPIRNTLQILKTPSADPAMIERSRQVMERQVQHLVRLVDDLLDVSRVMRGKIDLRKERIGVASIIAHAIETAQPLITAQGHELDVSIPSQSLEVEADPVRVAQVVSNLLTNAARYTTQPGRISLQVAPDGNRVVVRVRDNGIGIASEMLPRIFDLFVQADNSVARAHGGLGIGLTLVRSLVGMHGGEVEAKSAGLGQGSEFVVKLPLAPPIRSEDSALSSSSADSESGAPKWRILVVDDNADAADSLAILLELGGSDVQVAHDGLAALAIAETLRPDIIFLDIGMPQMDGYEVARRIRSTTSLDGVLLVALTGWGQEDDRRRSAEAGFDVHLVKPVEPTALETVLTHSKLPRMG
jgi:signal transduction histidine kinase/CheY-like chemotaxis protein